MIDIELTALSELFSTVGFPIALVCVLIFVIYQMGVRQNEVADNNMKAVQERCKEREEILMAEIKENRRINEKAIDTIAHYSEKLEIIQADIKEIKTDVTMLMAHEKVG